MVKQNMQTRMGLSYLGPAVQSGSMDVYEASANMIAFSEFVVLAAKAQFGFDADVRAKVTGFDRGSFVTDIVFQVTGASATIFSAATTKQLWETIESSIKVWKFLRGLQPRKVTHSVTPNSHQTVEITNNQGQIIQVSTQALTVVFSEKGSAAVGQFVRSALEQPGMDAVKITGESKEKIEISQTESDYFVPVAPSEMITDATIPMALIIEAPVFKEDNKWRFSDGLQSFFANIEDKEFLERVNAGERFGKGDILHADVRINQQQVGMKLIAERTVAKVREHRIGPKQLKLA
jgi:hypothetical protein